MKQREVQRLCLRCDWAGPTRTTACPRCGTALYRPAPAPVVSAPMPAPNPRPARVGRRLRPDRPPRRRPVLPEWARGVAGMAAVLVTAGAAVIVVGGNGPSAAPASPTPSVSAAPSGAVAGLDGFLVYAAPDGSTHDRLWIWDLAGARVLRGPRLPHVLALVDAYRLEPDSWIGATVEHGDQERGMLIRSWGPGARADPVVTGDRVAWSPGGLQVSAASLVGEGPCGTLVIRTVLPGFNLTQRSSARMGHECGALGAVGQGTGQPFVGILGGGTSSIYGMPVTTRPYLTNSVLLGVAPGDDLLVEPFSCIGPGSGPTTSSCPGAGVVAAGDPKASVRFPPGAPLLVQGPPVWSQDGRAAFVVGTSHDIHGTYVLRLSASGVPSAPRRVWQSLASDERVALTDDGHVILALDGYVSVMRHGEPVVLDRPGGPPPQGPIVWVRALPYSSG